MLMLCHPRSVGQPIGIGNSNAFEVRLASRWWSRKRELGGEGTLAVSDSEPFARSSEALPAKRTSVRLLAAKLFGHLPSAAREFRSKTKTDLKRQNSNPFA